MTKNTSKSNRYIILLILATFLLMPLAPIRAEGDIQILNIEIENVDGKTIKVKWQTDVDTTGRVIYGLKADSLVYFIGDANSARKYHEVVLNNLKSKTDYYYQVIAISNSEQVSSFVLKFKSSDYKDSYYPQVSNLETPYISGTTAYVTWETDEPSSSVVEYDKNGTYKLRATGNSKATQHEVVLKNLEPGKVYSIRAYSVDSDKNKSSYILKSFTTVANSNQDKEALKVNYIRPSSNDDENIGADNIKVSFKTNHLAKGTIKISAKGLKAQTYNTNWTTNHEVKAIGLKANQQYQITVSVVDVFNKKLTISAFTVTTKTAASVVTAVSTTGSSVSAQLASYTGNGNSSLAVGDLKCDANIFKTQGYYGQYFTAKTDTKVATNRTINDFIWNTPETFKMARVDQNVNFGKNFYALDNGANQRVHFFTYWRAIIDVPADGEYSYTLTSDDESWVYFDGVLNGKLGSNQGRLGKKTVTLTKGAHALEMYFVFRGRTGSTFAFTIDEKVKTYPWPNNCSIADIYRLKSGSTSGASVQISNNSGKVQVAGAEYSYYSQASAIYRLQNTPDIYSIVNGQRHFISSPASFAEYGYSWAKVKTVSKDELNKYPNARLVKIPEQNTIYFLYQRPENKWLKIAINSPTVFISYPGNYWGNIITINKLDLDSYPDVKLIKMKGDNGIYYLEDNTRRLVTDEVFNKKGFNPAEVVEVNKIQLESYKLGNPLQ